METSALRWFLFLFILDSNENVVVEYKYDAWGDHDKILRMGQI